MILVKSTSNYYEIRHCEQSEAIFYSLLRLLRRSSSQ